MQAYVGKLVELARAKGRGMCRCWLLGDFLGGGFVKKS